MKRTYEHVSENFWNAGKTPKLRIGQPNFAIYDLKIPVKIWKTDLAKESRWNGIFLQ